MHRVLRLWAILFPVFVLADQATALAGFRHLDLTFERFVALAVVPLVQAMTLAALRAARPRGGTPSVPAVGSRGRRLVVALVVADLVLLELAWAPIGLLARVDRFALLRLLVAVQALAGALAAATLALDRRLVRRQRVWLLPVGAVLAGTGASGLVDWVSALAALLRSALPEQVVRLLFVALPFVVGVVALAALRGAWEGRHLLAARLLDWALAGAVGLALVVALNRFWHPALPLFWSRVADSLGLVIVGALLVGFVVVWREREREPLASGEPPSSSPPAAAAWSWPALAGALVGSYVVARLGASLLVTGSLRSSVEGAVLAVAVPACELAALRAACAWRRRRRAEAQE